MKKLFVCLMAIVMVLAMAACGGTSEETKAADTTKAAEQSGSDAFVFTSNGVKVIMNAEAAPIVEALGEAKDYFESASCAFNGLDKQYTYNGFVLSTYPKEDVDYVYGVELKDDTVETAEGICIGSSYDDVVAKYGPADSETSAKYTKGDSQLLFLFTSGAVSSIQYLAVTE